MNIPDSKQPPRIAVVGPVPPPAGGMARQTELLTRTLRERGWLVEMIAVNAPYRPAWIAQFKALRAVFRLLSYVLTLWTRLKDQDLVHVMANSGWSWHLFAAPAIWIAKLRRVPVILHYRGGDAPSFFQRSWRWVRPSIAQVEQVWVPTGFLQQVFAQYGTSAQIMPNLLDLSRFSPRNNADGVHSGEVRSLVVTRNLESIYGIDTVIRAFAILHKRYPALHLTIAGSGPEETALKQLSRTLDIEQAVTFTGRLTPAEIIELYRNADTMLNASRIDNTPNAILEALASGVPVVSSNVGGIPFLVEDGISALLVEPDQPEVLADAVSRLIDSPKLRQKLIKSGLSLVEGFALDQVIERMEKGYTESISSRQRKLRTT